MRTTVKVALAAMALMGAAATPAAAQQFGLGIGPHGGISFSYDSGGYCDRWGCPDSFWDMPVYYGSVFVDGQWYDGPVYYRDWHGTRQFWIHGSWRRDEWRGPHPGWWRAGRYGPALGMDFYRSHNFHGRWDRDRGPDRNYGPRNDRGGPNFGPRDNRNDDRGGQRRDFNGPQNGPAPQQAQPNNAPHAFDPRQGRGQRWGQQPAQAPAAAPAQPPAAAPATPPTPGPDDHRHRDHQ